MNSAVLVNIYSDFGETGDSAETVDFSETGVFGGSDFGELEILKKLVILRILANLVDLMILVYLVIMF